MQAGSLRATRPLHNPSNERNVQFTLPARQDKTVLSTVVKFEEINLKVQKVRKSSRSTFSHSCQQKSLAIICTLEFMNFLLF